MDKTRDSRDDTLSSGRRWSPPRPRRLCFQLCLFVGWLVGLHKNYRTKCHKARRMGLYAIHSLLPPFQTQGFASFMPFKLYISGCWTLGQTKQAIWRWHVGLWESVVVISSVFFTFRSQIRRCSSIPVLSPYSLSFFFTIKRERVSFYSSSWLYMSVLLLPLRQAWSFCWQRSFRAASLCCCEQPQSSNRPPPCRSSRLWEATPTRRAWTLTPLSLVLANLPWLWTQPRWTALGLSPERSPPCCGCSCNCTGGCGSGSSGCGSRTSCARWAALWGTAGLWCAAAGVSLWTRGPPARPPSQPARRTELRNKTTSRRSSSSCCRSGWGHLSWLICTRWCQ